MSTIKNLVKSFQERQSTIIHEAPAVEKAPAQEAAVMPVIEEKIKSKAEKAPKKAALVKPESKKQQSMTAANVDFKLTDEFFASVNEGTFSYEKSKFAYIDKKIYEVLMTLKRKKDVKNISLLINAALAQFIEQHRQEIKEIFTDDLL